MKRKYQDYIYFDPNAGDFIDNQLQKYQNQLSTATSETMKSTINDMINTFTLEKDVKTKYNDLFQHDENGVIELPDYQWVTTHIGKLLTTSSSENYKNLSNMINSYSTYINELMVLGADTNTITDMVKWTEGYTRIAYRILYGTKTINADEDDWKTVSDNFSKKLEGSVQTKFGESEDLNIDVFNISHFDSTLGKYFPIIYDEATKQTKYTLYDNNAAKVSDITKKVINGITEKVINDNQKNNQNSDSTLDDFLNGFWNGFTHAPGMLGELITGGDVKEYIKNINSPNTNEAKDPFGLGKFFGSIIDSISKIFGGALGVDGSTIKWIFIGVVSYVIYREIKPLLKSSE